MLSVSCSFRSTGPSFRARAARVGASLRTTASQQAVLLGSRSVTQFAGHQLTRLDQVTLNHLDLVLALLRGRETFLGLLLRL